MIDKETLWRVTRDAIAEGLLICDNALTVLDVNHNLEIMLDLSDWQGKNVRDLFPWKINNVLNEVLKEIDSVGVSVYPRRVNFISSKGVLLPLVVSAEVITAENDDRLGYLFIFRDAIVQEELSSLSWINAIKSAYLATLGKAFYLPIHNLSRNIQDMMEFLSPEEEELRGLVQDALTELDKLRGVYDKFLDYSRIDAVCDKIVLREVFVPDVVNRALLLVVADRLEERIAVYPSGDLRVITDAFKLEQLLLLILDRLFSAMPEDSRLEIRMFGNYSGVEIAFYCDGRCDLENLALEDVDPRNTLTIVWRKDVDLEGNLIRWILHKLGISLTLKSLPEGKQSIRLKLPPEL